MQEQSNLLLPVLNRYLIRQFLGIFIPVIAVFILLYVVVDLFDRLDILLRHSASVGAATRYFLFKIPLMVTQMTPPAVITAVLISLGLLSRHNEIIALRASGVSLTQTAMPIMIATILMSLAVLAWNESVVPYCSRRYQYVNNIEIRKRALRSILSEREIWYHGKSGFYNISHVDKERQTIYGLRIYRLDDTFHLNTVIEVPSAQWADGHWELRNAVERQMEEGTFSVRPITNAEFTIPETLADFLEVQREPEELSYLQLRRWIDDLTQKGVDASSYRVDLHLKLALPFASAVLAFVALPISARVRRHPSVAATIGVGMTVGFAYWVVLALANSLGHRGVLPAVVAAWAANGFFVLVGATMSSYSE